MNDDLVRHPSVEELKQDRMHGASELARRALENLALFSETCEASDSGALVQQVDELASELSGARPGMAPIGFLIERWQRNVENATEMSLDECRSLLAAAARRVADTSRQAVVAVAEEVAHLIPAGAKLITLSRSSTLLEIFRRLGPKGVSVVVAESRPLLEGHAVVEELDRLAISAELITDAQLGTFVTTADIALVGADAVLADGSVINKAGTLLLALAAAAADVPFWVCCESFKRSPLSKSEFPLEEAEASQLGAPRLQHLRARNISFDVTPGYLVTRWIDERGSTLGRPR